MNNSSNSDRSQMEREVKPTTKIERDMGRICPSKLSRRELEDLYFTLLENNLDLKRTINKQNEKIRILSTRVQRLSSGRISTAANCKEKDCCTNKALINELKDTITELKKANDGLAERIRLLNMRLCSAKQFLNKTPSHKCNYYYSPSSSTAQVKDRVDKINSPITPPVQQEENGTNKSQTAENFPLPPTTDEVSREGGTLCNKNVCKITVEELRQTISNLQEELANSRAEYSARLGRLEGEVRSAREENVVARADSRTHQERGSELLQRLHTVDAKADDLKTRLSIEKRKVLELETRLKLADMSVPLAKSIDKLTAMSEPTLDNQRVPPESLIPPSPNQTKESKEQYKKREVQSPDVAIKKNERDVQAGRPLSHYTPPQLTGSVFRYTPPQKKDKKFTYQKPKREIRATRSVKTQTPKYDSNVPIQEPKAVTQTAPFQGAAPAIPFQEDSAIQKQKADAKSIQAEDVQEVPAPLALQEPSPVGPFQEAGLSKLETPEGPEVDTEMDDLRPYMPAFLAATSQKEAEAEATSAVPLQEAKQKSITSPAVLVQQQNLRGLADEGSSFQVAGPPIPYQEARPSTPIQETKQEYVTVPAVPIQEQKFDKKIDQVAPFQAQAVPSVPFQGVRVSAPFQEAKKESVIDPAVSLPTQTFSSKVDKAAPSEVDGRSIPFQEAKQQFEPTPADPIPDQNFDPQPHQPVPIQVAGPSIRIHDQIYNETKPTVPFKEAKITSKGQKAQTVKAIPLPEPRYSLTSRFDSVSIKTAYQDAGAYDVSIHEPSHDSQTSHAIPVAGRPETRIGHDFPYQRTKRDSVFGRKHSYHDLSLPYDGHDVQIHEPADSLTSHAIPVAAKRELKLNSDEFKSSDYQIRKESILKEPPLFYDPSKIIDMKGHETPKEKSESESPSTSRIKIKRLIDINPRIDDEHQYRRETPTSSYSPTQVIKMKEDDLEVRFQPTISPYYSPIEGQNVQLEVPSTSPKKGDELKFSNADDSGYVEQEPQKDDEMLRINRELLKKISDLRAQLDVLVIAAAGANNKPTKTTPETRRENGPSVTTPSDEESLRGYHSKRFDEIVAEIDSDERLHSLQKTSHNTEPELPFSNTKEMTTSLLNVRDKLQVPPTEEEKDEYSDEDEIKKPLLKKAEVIQHMSPTVEETKSLRFDNRRQELEDPKLSAHSGEEQRRDSKTGKQDDHNSLQIPGPIPSIYPPTREKKAKDKKTQEEKTVTIVASPKDEAYGYIYIPKEVKKQSVHLEDDDKITTFLNNLKERRRSKGGIVTEEEYDRDRYKQESDHAATDSYSTKHVEDKKAVDTSLLDLSDIVENGDMSISYVDASTQVEEDKDRVAVCWQAARVCACARRAGAVPPLRTCSGALRVLAPDAPAAHAINYCACEHHQSSAEGRRISGVSTKSEFQPHVTVTRDLQHPQTQAQAPSCSHPLNENTYTHSKCSRSTSPDNTEREISSLPDLPDEKEVKYHHEYLSPGEKGTMTTTDTETNTDFGILSEGEIPATKKLQKSCNEKAVATATPGMESTQRMEAALQAISEELMRCHKLLESQTNKRMEDSHKQSRDDSEIGVPLRSTDASQRLAGTHHVCVFTLHVGTLVLSDEAVLNFRDKSLVLMWRYYDQSVTLTRMRAGRVVLFDFSTEYDVVFSEDFLKYMKHDKMPLVICEMNKQDEPIASCSLPLRDALLHLNRRADMSLALMAGGEFGPGAEEELGVLDLWCLLRADSTVSRHVAHAISRSSQVPGSGRSFSRLISLVEDGSISNERLSQDLELNIKSEITPPNKKLQRQSLVTYPTQEPVSHNNLFGYDDHRNSASASKSRRRSSNTRKSNSIVSSNLGHREQQRLNGWPGNRMNVQREGSGLIANTVPAYIKSTEEMKAAIERKAQHDDTRRIGKNDDTVSQGQLSIGSVRSQSRKHQLARLKDLNKYYPHEPIESLQDLLKDNVPTKDRKHSYNNIPKCELAPTEYDKTDEVSDISRKYKDISKFLGVNKMMESKKQVKYSDGDVRPEKEVVNSDTEGHEGQSIEITVLWLALNEECDAMVNPNIKRLYVAYNFLGRSGADLETPVSLPKPKHYVDKCFFNFRKTFNLHECDLVALGHMARVRSGSRVSTNPRDCLVFTVVSEPPEDPLGLSSCEDVGYAYLYLGDILAYSGGSSVYTEVVAVHAARGAAVCGVLAVRIDGLEVLRRALTVSNSTRDLSRSSASGCAGLQCQPCCARASVSKRGVPGLPRYNKKWILAKSQDQDQDHTNTSKTKTKTE